MLSLKEVLESEVGVLLMGNLALTDQDETWPYVTGNSAVVTPMSIKSSASSGAHLVRLAISVQQCHTNSHFLVPQVKGSQLGPLQRTSIRPWEQ